MSLAIGRSVGDYVYLERRIEDQHGFLQKSSHESLGPMKVVDSLPSFPASSAAACGDSSILLELLAVNCRLLAGLSPLECAVPKKGGGASTTPIALPGKLPWCSASGAAQCGDFSVFHESPVADPEATSSELRKRLSSHPLRRPRRSPRRRGSCRRAGFPPGHIPPEGAARPA